MKKTHKSVTTWLSGFTLTVAAVNLLRLLEYLAPGIAAHIALGVTGAGIALICILSWLLRTRRTAPDTASRDAVRTLLIVRSASLGATFFGLIGLLSVLSLDW